MTTPKEAVRHLAMLVHRGLLGAEDVRAVLEREDPLEALVESGVVDRSTLDLWIETEGNTRPRLSRYELLDRLGEGGQAFVYRARDRRAGEAGDGAPEELALKILKPELARNQRSLKAFVDEAKQLISLSDESKSNPHVVRGFRVAKESTPAGPVFFCAMEYVRGECLQESLDRDGRLEEEKALQVVAQVADALDHLRRQGLVHRDVKPANVMWTPEGRAVLIDLGFALDTQSGAEGETTAGTVHYISPEQARADGELDVRADIYSLGATLYHLVTGSLPFEGDSGDEVLRKQVLESLSGERIRELGLSPQLHFLIEKMMAKEREIRFQDPAELKSSIDSVLRQREREREEAERSTGFGRRSASRMGSQRRGGRGRGRR